MTAKREAMTLEQLCDMVRAAATPQNAVLVDDHVLTLWADARDALSRAAEPVGWLSDEDIADLQTNRTDEEGVDAIECFLWREQAHEQLRAIYAHPPEPARDAAIWKLAFINERARTYQSKGMKIEQARIHAEADAAHGLIAMAQESGE